jgi:hypothetical protein
MDANVLLSKPPVVLQISEGKGELNTNSYHGVPDDVLDGIFSEKDKKAVKPCSLCGCTCNDHLKESLKKKTKRTNSIMKKTEN